MKKTSACLMEIFFVVLTFGIFASSVASMITNPKMKLEATTAIVFGMTIAGLLNIVAIRELRDIALNNGQPQQTGFWICTAVYNIVIIFLVSKYGFQLF